MAGVARRRGNRQGGVRRRGDRWRARFTDVRGVQCERAVDATTRQLLAMQTANPETLYLYGCWPVASVYEAERRLHERYAKRRRQGEWFELEAEHLRELDAGLWVEHG